jgi:hypothetical protein
MDFFSRPLTGRLARRRQPLLSASRYLNSQAAVATGMMT